MKCLPSFEKYPKHLDIFGRSLKKVLIILPSRELAYRPVEKGKSSSKRDMLVP